MVSTPSSPEGTAEVFGGAQGFVSCDRAGGDGLPRFGVLAGRDDSVGAAVCDCIVAFAGVVGAISRNAADLLVFRDLVEKVG